MLVGAKNGNIKVGEVEKDHKDEVRSHHCTCTMPVNVALMLKHML